MVSVYVYSLASSFADTVVAKLAHINTKGWSLNSPLYKFFLEWGMVLPGLLMNN
jgi:hypothetical protein